MRRVLVGSGDLASPRLVGAACRKTGIFAEVFRIPIARADDSPYAEGYDAILGRAYDTLAIVRSRDPGAIAVAVESGRADEGGVPSEISIVAVACPESREPVIVEVGYPVSGSEEFSEESRVGSAFRAVARRVGYPSEDTDHRDTVLIRAIAEAIGIAVETRSANGP